MVKKWLDTATSTLHHKVNASTNYRSDGSDATCAGGDVSDGGRDARAAGDAVWSALFRRTTGWVVRGADMDAVGAAAGSTAGGSGYGLRAVAAQPRAPGYGECVAGALESDKTFCWLDHRYSGSHFGNCCSAHARELRTFHLKATRVEISFTEGMGVCRLFLCHDGSVIFAYRSGRSHERIRSLVVIAGPDCGLVVFQNCG
jgi:hypothetical protein